MSRQHNTKFVVGAVFVGLGMAVYLADRFLGHELSVLDFLWHAMPMVIGGCLMMPKLTPNLYNRALETVRGIFGRNNTGGGTPSIP